MRLITIGRILLTIGQQVCLYRKDSSVINNHNSVCVSRLESYKTGSTKGKQIFAPLFLLADNSELQGTKQSFSQSLSHKQK